MYSLLYMWSRNAILVLFIVQVGVVMKIVSFSEARNRLKNVLDDVVNDADCTVITRRDAEDAVVMSLDYFNGLMETVHLLRSLANVVHLERSIAQFKAGEVVKKDRVDD